MLTTSRPPGAGALPPIERARLRTSLIGWVTAAALMVATDLLVAAGSGQPQTYLAAFLVISGVGLFGQWSVFAVLVCYVMVRYTATGETAYTLWLLAACLVSFASWRLRERATARQRQAHTVHDHEIQHDSLTGLPVRSRLRTIGAQLVPEVHSSLTLALVDLDRAVEINRVLGRDAGDRLVAEIAARIVAVVRPGDVVARAGSTQFAVLLPDASLPFARSIAEAVRRAVTTPLPLGDVAVDVGASVGIAEWQVPAEGPLGVDAAQVISDLLRHAEIAMHEAKTELSPAMVYHPTLEDDGADRLALLTDLSRAIDERALLLTYQPVLDLETSRVRAVEALVHWPHPTRGLLLPEEFVPIADATALNLPLSTLVLDLALAQAAVLASVGREVEMSVNVAPRTLLTHGFTDSVIDALDRHEVPPSRLRLEVTEEALSTDPIGARAVLDRLADRGVRISIDSYGAGCSSLAVLRDLPIDELKIDCDFVTGLATTAADSTGGDPMVVRAAILVGHALGLRVVAKGVEDAATVETVQILGCDCAQGFYLSRPLPPELLLESLEERTLHSRKPLP